MKRTLTVIRRSLMPGLFFSISMWAQVDARIALIFVPAFPIIRAMAEVGTLKRFDRPTTSFHPSWRSVAVRVRRGSFLPMASNRACSVLLPPALDDEASFCDFERCCTHSSSPGGEGESHWFSSPISLSSSSGWKTENIFKQNGNYK